MYFATVFLFSKIRVPKKCIAPKVLLTPESLLIKCSNLRIFCSEIDLYCIAKDIIMRTISICFENMLERDEVG